jgi:hypothetical protein
VPNKNDVESYWEHREEEPEVVAPLPVDGWVPNPSGREILNILLRTYVDVFPAPSPVDNAACSRIRSYYSARTIYQGLPDYERTRTHFVGENDDDCVTILDRIAYGNAHPLDLSSGEILEYLHRRYTPPNAIATHDHEIMEYISDRFEQDNGFPPISVLRGAFHSNIRARERILELIVTVGGLEIRLTPATPREAEAPALDQTTFNLRQLNLLLHELQVVVENIGGDTESIDGSINELLEWAGERSREASLPNTFWRDTLRDFGITYTTRGTNRAGNDADRRIIAYIEQYMSMTRQLPGYQIIREYFSNQPSGDECTRRLTQLMLEQPVSPRDPGRPITEFHTPNHNIADLQLPESLSNEERTYASRINLRRSALLVEALTQTSIHMSTPLPLNTLREFEQLLEVMGAEYFLNQGLSSEPDWRNRTLHDFRVEFLFRDAQSPFPRPAALYPTERRAYPPSMNPISSGSPTPRVADDNFVTDDAIP